MKPMKVKDLCSLVVDCPHSTPVWTDSGVLVFRSPNIRNGRLDLSQRSFTTEEEYSRRVRRAVPSPGDIIITREAPMGEVAIIPEGVRGCLGQRMVLLRPETSRTDSRYLLYALMSPMVQEEIKTHEGTGSTVSNLRIPALEALEIPAPTLAEQRAIAHILGTLDDKIELNRRMNETLEAMARALFKSWFVDFDPVRAKMRGVPHPKSLSQRERDFPPPSPSGRGVGGEGNISKIRPNAPIPTELLDFARELRSQSTDAEALLWRLLRGRQVANTKFRRQHSFPPYILDFYCHELRLAIELDGGQHNVEQNRNRDARRDQYLAEHGIRMLRFWNNDVLRETEAVLEAIYAAVVDCASGVPSPPAPLPEGEGSIGPSPSRREVWDEGIAAIPSDIADLFPDSFEDSALGEIPKGWDVKPLPEVIDVNPTRSLRKGEPAPYLDMANMPTRGHTPDDVVDRPFGSGTRFVNGDTLVARITPCLENGKTAFVDFLRDGQIGWGSTEYIVLRPKSPLPGEFAYCLARSDEFREFAIQSMTGSSGRQRVPAESLSHYLLAVPPEQLAKRFGSIVKLLFARASTAARESRTLASQRDTLLPKLISGELRVRDAERDILGYA